MSHSTKSARARVLAWIVIAVLGAFLTLAALFALITTTVVAWNERAQRGWPEARAGIEQCKAGRSFYGRPAGENPYIIECRIAYEVNGRRIETSLHSATSLSPQVLEAMMAWVGRVSSGAVMEVHYDPTDPDRAVLTATDMPLGGPRTPSNLRTLRLFAIACALVLLLAWATRPKASTWATALGR